MFRRRCGENAGKKSDEVAIRGLGWIVDMATHFAALLVKRSPFSTPRIWAGPVPCID